MDKRLGDRKTTATARRPADMAASPFVGREDQLRRLQGALTLAAAGKGGTIFVSGQPGIGKTRLVREALALARGRSFTVLQGRAYPTDARLAYAPFLDAFGPLLRRYDAVRLESLVDDLPELGRLLGCLRLPPTPFSETLGDPALEKTRLFEAVSWFLARLTKGAPVALFIDDIHWADPATLDLLHYLARGLSDKRALLLAAYRTNDLGASGDLAELVESLQRAGMAEEIAVPHLEPDAIEKLVNGILGGEAPGELLSLLKNRAAGTPLFVEAFIDSLIDSGHVVRTGADWTLAAEGIAILPPSIRRLIRRRLARLAPADRRVIDLVAVLGDATSHTVLLAASGLDDGKLIESLRRLQDAGLMAEGLDGSDVVYSITHPLTQEVVYAEQPEMARRRAHLAAIEALESFFSEGRPADVNRLAHHYRGAGPEAKIHRALTALIAAGERALSLYANKEAARHFEAALAIVRQGGVLRIEGRVLPEKDPSTLYPQHSTLPALLERLGEAWERIGKRGAAIELWNEALVEQERAGDAVAASRLRRQLALAEWDRGNFDIANAHLSAGLTALADHDLCQELADLHFTRFQILSRLGEEASVGETVAELASLAKRLASPGADGEANLAASYLCLWQNDLTNARKHALHVLSIGERAHELAVCCRAHWALAAIGVRLGDHQFVRWHAELGLAVAQRLGSPRLEIMFRHRLACANLMSGAWDESERCSMEAVALARRVGNPRDQAYSLAERAMILALRGDLGQAKACISETRTAFGSGSPADRAVFGFIEIVEMALGLGRGQTDQGLAIAGGLADQRAPLVWSPAGLMMAYMPMGFMLLAEAQVAAGDPHGALETAGKIVHLGPTGTPYLVALASRAEGLAHQALGQQEDARVCLERAYDNFTALDMPFEAARTLFEQAVLTAKTRPELAVRVAQQSLAVFERLGVQRFAESARRLLQGLGISTLVTRRPRLGGGFVTARELEIARLVAQGLSTPQIAERLAISPRTISNHLEHIYDRLGIGSRTALARHVIEAGLIQLQDQK